MTAPNSIPGLFDSLKSTIQGWIQDKITIINGKTIEASNSATAAANSATNAATSASNASSAVNTAITALKGGVSASFDTLKKLADGKADLVSGQIPTSQIPAVALTKPSPVASRAAMLALTAEEGDVAVITSGADKGTYMLGTGASTSFASWIPLVSPDAPVQSVNSQTGTVNLSAANVGAAPSVHTHGVDGLVTTGTPSSTTALYGDFVWRTPTNTTYASMSQARADTGTATTANSISAKVLRDTINKAAVQNATYGTPATIWYGPQAAYNALPVGTKNAAGFIAIITE